MATLDDRLQQQKSSSVLQAPTTTSPTATSLSSLTSSTLSVALVNNTTSSNVYAYVSGLDINNNYDVFMLQSNGSTVYHPTSPSSTGTALSANCAIALGAPGSTTTITVPQTAGGRIWFSRDATLTFLINPGPALVEPSVTNTADPNYQLYWDFCEFTFNTAELFINITYVDFVCLPISLQLQNTSGNVTTVKGLPSNGLNTICSGLTAQTASDGAGWSSLIVPKSSTGANLRALSPNSGITMNNSLFNGYYQSYVNQVWSKYTGSALQVDTQASYGIVSGQVANSQLAFGSAGSFPQPSTADIFSCSTGAFAVNGAEMGNIAARLAAAFNRSTLLIDSLQPDNEVPSTYYTNAITNHYARICHATNLDGKGYAFPYDDVAPSGGADQSGSLYDPNPQLLTVAVGGPSNTSSRNVRLRDMATRQGQRPAGLRQGQHQFHSRVRRDLSWAPDDDEKRMLAASDSYEPSGDDKSNGNDSEVDLEKGFGRGQQALLLAGDEDEKSLLSPRHSGEGKGEETLYSSSSVMTRSLTSFVPRAWADKVTKCLERLEASPFYANTRPVVDFVVRLMTIFLSMSVRALVSRVTMALFLVLFYLVVPAIRGSTGGDVASGPTEMTRVVMVDPVNVTSILMTQR